MLSDLLTVCPAPAVPESVPTADQWKELESEIGTTFPADYRAMIDKYGDGVFGSNEAEGAFFDLAYLVHPGGAPNTNVNAFGQMRELTEAIGKMHDRWPDMIPAPAWPSPGGLLYAGRTTTQNEIYWKTVGQPDDWICTVCDHGCEYWFEWNGDVTSLLAAIVTKRVPDWIVEGPTRFPLVFRTASSLVGAKLV